jgi:CHRD domain-containing protein
MRRSLLVRNGLVAALLVIAAGTATAQEFKARLSGFFEIGALNNNTGAILTAGTGKLSLDVGQNSATYTLTYSGLGSNVTQAHIHFGKVHVAGGIFAFLCTNLGNGPAGTPACPAAGGTVTGTITPTSIIAVPGQNITAGDFNALLAAVGSNTAYANVHTVKFPAGEIRGQVKLSDEDGDEGQGNGRKQ